MKMNKQIFVRIIIVIILLLCLYVFLLGPALKYQTKIWENLRLIGVESYSDLEKFADNEDIVKVVKRFDYLIKHKPARFRHFVKSFEPSEIRQVVITVSDFEYIYKGLEVILRQGIRPLDVPLINNIDKIRAIKQMGIYKEAGFGEEDLFSDEEITKLAIEKLKEE